MNNRQAFWRAFFIALAIQLIIYAIYYFFGVGKSAEGTALQRAMFLIYRPIFLLGVMVVKDILITGSWAGLGFVVLFAPLIGAFVYSFIVAFITLLFRKGYS